MSNRLRIIALIMPETAAPTLDRGPDQSLLVFEQLFQRVARNGGRKPAPGECRPVRYNRGPADVLE